MKILQMYYYINLMNQSDVLIIGAGVAGLSAGLYAARSGMKVYILDEAGAGGQVLQINDLENYPGVFPAVNGTDLIKTMETQAETFGVKIIQTSVTSIDKKGNFYSVKTSSEEYSAPAVIIATGADHSKLNVPGETEFTGRGVSYCAICDGPFFKNKNVCVIGGGDSACTEALYLADIASHVDLIHRRDQLRTQKTNADKVFANEKISVHFDSIVKQINGGPKVESLTLENVKTGEKSDLPTDGVFIFVGMVPRTSLLEILPKDDAGYILTNEKMETAIPGLFVAGDVRSKPLRQIVTATSDGAIAGFAAAEYVKSLI